MAGHNDITGDALVSKVTNKNFDTGYESINWSVKLEPEPIKPLVQIEIDFEEDKDLEWEEN